MLVKMSIDPFEIATNEYDTPPDSPLDIEATTEAGNEEDILKEDIKTNNKGGTSATATPINSDGEDDEEVSQPPLLPNATAAEEPPKSKDEEEENMDVELSKYQSGDPDKVDKFTTVLAQLTPDQMNRYESFRRSGFQKANMRRVLQSIAGCPISHPMTIVMSGIAKMFVGELVEMGRMVMTERNESGPIRPCHIREAYRRLKLEGKDENPKKTGAPNAVCLYSIASTKYGDSFDGKTTLCVRRAVYYDTVSGKDPSKNGICSNYLCDGKPGDKVQITGRDPMNSEL